MEIFENGIKYSTLLAFLVCIYSYIKQPSSIKEKILIILLLSTIAIWSTFFLKGMSFFWIVKRVRYLLIQPIILILWVNLFKENIHVIRKQKIINYSIYLYFIIILFFLSLSFFKIDLGFSYFSILNNIGAVLFAFTGFQYLNYISNTKDIINIWRNPLFYICFALLFLLLGSIPLDSLKVTLIKGSPNLYVTYMFATILFHYLLNIVLCFILLIKKIKF